jgi:hypothetical protein
MIDQTWASAGAATLPNRRLLAEAIAAEAGCLVGRSRHLVRTNVEHLHLMPYV